MGAEKQATLTKKGQQTKDRIFKTALDLFCSKGYEATTLRDIAAAAECSLGLTYRYFGSKEELVLELYRHLATQFEEQAQALPPGSMADRFRQAMELKIKLLEPYREVMGALFSAAVNPQSDISVLGQGAADIRANVGKVYLMVVTDASDTPKAVQPHHLVTLLYVMHLMILLFWLHDSTPGFRSTHEILKLARDLLHHGRHLLRLPPFVRLVTRFAEAVAPVITTN